MTVLTVLRTWHRAGFVAGVVDTLRPLARGLHLVLSVAPRGTTFYAALTVVIGLLPVAQTWLTKALIDGLSGSLGAMDTTGAPAKALLLLALVSAMMLMLLGALEPLHRTLSRWIEELTIGVIDRTLIDAGGHLADLCRIERPAFGDELRLVEWEAHSLAALLRLVGHFASAALALAGMLVLLGTLHPVLPLVLTAFAWPHLLVERRLQNQIYEYMSTHSRAAREMHYCVQVTTGASAAKEVRVFGLGDFFLRRYEARRDAALREVTRVRLRYLGQSAVLTALHALALAGGFGYVAGEAAYGRFTAGDVALYTAVLLQTHSTVGSLSVFALLHRTHRQMGGFFAFLDRARPAIQLAPPHECTPVPSRLRQGVTFHRVRFAYPESASPVLGGVSFTLPAGKVTAIVGHNGAGKSTLVKLLTRMYDPTEGEILLDGRPFAAYDLASLRSRIGVVYQDFARFALSLRENIAVGAGDLASSPAPHHDAVEHAAQLAGADAIAAALPSGYDTTLTRRFDGGVELSGGQWQKVALARGLMRDAALVILDEPTSALDAAAEHRLIEQFREAMRGRTALVISHRLSTVRLADHIVVLADGHIVEEGTHESLLTQGGYYSSLFEMQASRYQQ